MSATGNYVWSAVQRFGSQGIGFLGNVLIARELTPDDFGLIAMLAIFLGVAMNFTESGFCDYLISQPQVEKSHYSTAFVHNVCFGVVFALGIYLAGDWIASFYERPELAEVTNYIGVVIILKASVLTEITRMRKELEFKKMALIQITSSLVSVFVGYRFAISGWGYWALVVQATTLPAVTLLLVLVFNKWQPGIDFRIEKYREMKAFGNKMLQSYLTTQLATNVYSTAIGKVDTTTNLGFYSQAEKINNVGFGSLNSIILTTSYPLLARERDPRKRLRMYNELLRTFFFFHFLASFLLLGVAEPLIQVVYGQNWAGTAPMLSLMIVAFLGQPFSTVNNNIAKIHNKPVLYRNMSIVRNLLLVTSLVVTYKMGITAMLFGQVVARYLSVAFDVFSAGNVAGFSPSRQFLIMAKQIFAPLSSFLLILFVQYWVGIGIIGLISCFLALTLFFNVLIGNIWFYKMARDGIRAQR